MGEHQIDLGDCGQRFEVVGHAIESGNVEVIGWTNNLQRAQKLVEAVQKWPRYNRGWIIDRKT